MTGFLLLIIVGLIIYMNRTTLHRLWCEKTGNFTAHRVHLTSGQWFDLIAYDELDSRRIMAELRPHLEDGEPWNDGSTVWKIDTISGKNHDRIFHGREAPRQ